MHLNAAIALSELSAAAVAKVDVGIQTDMEWRQHKSRASMTTQTQTSATAKKRSAETQTKKPSTGKRRKKASTQEPLFDYANEDDEVSVLLSKDRPLSWAVCSTQTSPKYGGTSSLSAATAADPGTNLFLGEDAEKSHVGVSCDMRHRPRLGEIEQFSTETQTDLGTATSNATEWAILDASELPLQIEAETQFDLDDILCSNYTQTRAASAASVILDADDETASSAPMNSIETQTIHPNIFYQGSDAGSAAETMHMETQTTTTEL